MPITPDDLAARFAAPASAPALLTRAADFTAAAYALAEQAMDALPRGHFLDQAVDALERASHWVSAGLAAVEADAAADELATQAAELQLPFALAAPAPAELGELALNVSLWRTCLRGALQLHPYARLVAYTLADSADDRGFIADADQPEIEVLALATGLDVGMALQALEELATHGWIGRHNDGRGTTRYQLRQPAQVS
jgi:hypothetical protein